jgi:hypothetical protein
VRVTTQLTAHFSLEELTASATARDNGFANLAPADALRNLIRLADVLETARTALGCALLVSSGYRSPALNAAVGGSRSSAHLDGRAADFRPAAGTLEDALATLVASTVLYDQLIIERTPHAAWLHLGIARLGAMPRRECLAAAGDAAGAMTYTRVAEG